MRLRALPLLVSLLACGDDDSVAPADLEPTDMPVDAGPTYDPDCDPIDPTACALPWPSSLYLEPTDDTVTGVQLAFGEGSLPRNSRGVAIAPERFAGLDGYGHGTPILFDLGPLDFDTLAGEWSGLERSLEADSPTLLLKVTAAGLERVPHFVEPDRNASRDPLTILRPAVILEPATRYIVALRDLRGADGVVVEPSDAFAALRDDTPSDDPRVEARRASFDALFAELEAADVARADLVLAWDFVTGSTEALHHRLDRAIELGFAAAPDGGALRIDSVDEPDDDEIRYRVRGTMTVPSVVEAREDDELEAAGFELALDAEGEVVLNGTREVPFMVQVPHRAVGGEPVGVMMYGHGLFGNETEVRAGHIERLAEEFGYVVISVPMLGMASDDLETVIGMTRDLNKFVVISDALHQGILDHHMLLRAGATTLEALLQAEVDAEVAIDDTLTTYFGGSQGGIFGQTILATSPDLSRGVLAVPGNNYATLLQRSSNFDQFGALFRASYRTDLNVAIALAAIQLLWDRTDPVSYLDRMLHGPAFGDPERQGLLLLSKGDYQVAVLTNEIAARTWPGDLAVMEGYDERIPFGITPTPYPVAEGSAMILFDFGNPWPMDRGNLAPMDELGDPHGRISSVEPAGGLIDIFLREGRVTDVCGGDGCNPD